MCIGFAGAGVVLHDALLEGGWFRNIGPLFPCCTITLIETVVFPYRQRDDCSFGR